MPARTAPKAPRARKAYPKRKSVRSTLFQRAKTLEYAASPHPPVRMNLPTLALEQKFFDGAVVAKQCNKNPSLTDIVHLNNISQGVQVRDRQGMRYAMTGLHIRGTIYYNPTSLQLANPCVAGYYVVYDTSPNGVQATAADMFNVNSTNMIFAYPNASAGQVGGRFKYITRKCFTVGNSNGNTANPSNTGVPGLRVIDDYIPLNKLVTQMERLQTSGTIGHTEKGALYLIPFGQPSSTVGGGPASGNIYMEAACRLYFTDQ